MNTYLIALSNVLIMLFYLIPGFVIRKMNKASEEHLPTLSAVLIYAGTPFLEISAFLDLEFSPEGLADMGIFFLLSLGVQALFMLGVWFFFCRGRESVTRRILTVSSIAGNVGFFGLPIVRALFPETPQVASFAAIYMVSMNLIAFTFGVFFLTGDKKYVSLKSAICNPTVFGFALALPVYLFGVKAWLPDVMASAIKTVGSMTTPLCMIVLGIRLASAPVKSIISQPSVWLASAFKLIVFPLFAYGAVYFLPVSQVMKAALLVTSATPCAAVILSLSELHHTRADIPADTILISTIFCFLTLPTLTLLLP